MRFIGQQDNRVAADAVLAGYARGARTGVLHLIRHGHKRIGYIGCPSSTGVPADIYRGYRKAMRQAGVGVRRSWLAVAPPAPTGMGAALTPMLSSPDPVAAVFCGTYRAVRPVLREFSVRKRMPALISFDDAGFADVQEPGVTIIPS
jgi:LacI family transcriptional regulator